MLELSHQGHEVLFESVVFFQIGSETIDVELIVFTEDFNINLLSIINEVLDEIVGKSQFILVSGETLWLILSSFQALFESGVLLVVTVEFLVFFDRFFELVQSVSIVIHARLSFFKQTLALLNSQLTIWSIL